MIKRKVQLNNLAEIRDFIILSSKYRCNIKVKACNKIVDGKSMMGIISLMAHQPLTIIAEGEDACEFAGQLDKSRYLLQ
ncbi:MAG: HPr family phosphocarrier protein [Caldicoprobacterales bacterium]|nr:HPr family phosphocarrier protein [Clostridiales bacterium]